MRAVGRHDIARIADHEQVAQSLVEHELGRCTRVRTAQHDCERALRARMVLAPRMAQQRFQADHVVDETAVALAQAREGLFRVELRALHGGLSDPPAA